MSPASAESGNDGQRTGLMFPGAPKIPDMVRLAQRAEARGFDSAWFAETRITRDGVTPLAAMAAATDRIKIGSAIVNVFTRGPVVLACTFTTLNELAPGRILMGLGAGSPAVLGPQGVEFKKPLTRMREYVTIIQPLIRGEEVTFDGETVSVDGARIEDILSASGSDAGATAAIPLYLGVTGPRALEYAGEVADGVLLNAILPTTYVERARGLLQKGAQRANRSVQDLDVAMIAIVSPDADAAAGKNRARDFLAVYLSMFPNLARETGLDEALVESIRTTFNADGVEAAARNIDDSVVDQLCAAGSVEECRERLQAYRQAGVDLPILTPLDGTMELAIDELG